MAFRPVFFYTGALVALTASFGQQAAPPAATQSGSAEASSPADTVAQVAPDVDQALRARATEFLQHGVDGTYRRAMALVAEDSQDYYFDSAKPKYLSFKIDSIEYSDNFTKAKVKALTKQKISVLGNQFDMDLPVVDSWKLEGGKWVWYKDPDAAKVINTPFGPVATVETPANGEASPVPKDVTPEAVAAAAAKLNVTTSINAREVHFTDGKAGTGEVIFTNGAPGVVKLQTYSFHPQESLRAEPATQMVKSGEDVHVKIFYAPTGAGESQEANQQSYVRLTVQPFGRDYYVPVFFDPAK